MGPSGWLPEARGRSGRVGSKGSYFLSFSFDFFRFQFFDLFFSSANSLYFFDCVFSFFFLSEMQKTKKNMI